MTVRSRNARSWETITAPPGRSATKRSSRARPSKSRSLVGSSSSRTSKRESRIAASEARAAWPPDERHGLEVEQRRVQPEVAQDGLRARLEVGAAEREPRLERVRVALGGAGRVGRHRVAWRRARARRRRRRRCGARGSPAAARRARGRAPAAGSRRRPAVRRTLPRSGRSSPASSRSSVDLPAPFGPTTPSTSPGATVTETPARIVAAPCALCSSRAISVPAIALSLRAPRRVRSCSA